MTLQEFKNVLQMQYTFGLRRTDGASRRYHDSNLNLGCEVHTPYNEETMEWGKGEAFYYMEDDDRNFKSIDELYEAWKEKQSDKN